MIPATSHPLRLRLAATLTGAFAVSCTTLTEPSATHRMRLPPTFIEVDATAPPMPTAAAPLFPWVGSLDHAMQRGRIENKPVLIAFSAREQEDSVESAF